MAKSRVNRTIMDEMFMTLSVFTRKETFLGYVKLSITRDLFESEDEYNEFYELLTNFHELMMKGNQTYTVTLISELDDSFNALASRFPEQTDKLILETIYDARQTERVPNALNYISKKNVVSTKFTSITAGNGEKAIYTMGMLSSSTINKYLDDGKLSKSEQYFCDTFLATERGIKMLEFLSPADISRCVQDTRMMSAVYFSITNIFESTEKGEERLDLLTQYLYGDIRNFNLDRFRLILYYRYFKEMNKLNEFTTANIDLLEALRQECGASIPSAPLSLDEIRLSIPDLSDKEAFEINLISAPTGRILPMNSVSRKSPEPEVEPIPTKNILEAKGELPDFSKLNLTDFGSSSHKLSGTRVVEEAVQDFPTFAVTTDNRYITRDVVLPREEVISKKVLLKEIEDLLLALKFDQIIEIYRDDIQKRNGNEENSEKNTQIREQGYKYASIKECLKGITLNKDNLEIFSSRILEKVRFENLECDSKEIEEIFKSEKKAIIVYLFNEKIFSLSTSIEFDFEAVCAGIQDSSIQVTAEDLVRTRLLKSQKETFINMAITNEDLLQALLNSNSISRLDVLNLDFDCYAKLVPILCNRNILSFDDLVLLLKQGKITLTDISNFDLENVHILDTEIISKYSEIYRKRLEYEEAAKANYESAIQNGVKDEDIKESDEEIRLRQELQELIYSKDVYITLFKKQKMSQLEEYHRRQDIYMGIIEECYDDANFEYLIADITNMLYSDNFISMAQVQQFDDSLFIPILKSGMAKREDIDKFKQEIVSVDEINKIRVKLSDKLSGKVLEEEIKKQVYILTYEKLSTLMEKIISDPNSTKEEKLSILYSIFSKNNNTETTHREFYETEILVKIYGKLKAKRKKPVIDPKDAIISEEEVEEEKTNTNTSKTGHNYSSREFVYPTNIIWKFIELLDSDFIFRILADGYVVFESEKLNKVFIENVWQANREGDFVRRGYGATTLILDLDTYRMHQSEIVKVARHGYKVDVSRAKSYLPQIQTTKGLKPTGMIIHEKDLKNTGKKVWFELILEHLGITQANVNAKTTSYTQEDLDKINKFIMNSKSKREEITK